MNHRISSLSKLVRMGNTQLMVVGLGILLLVASCGKDNPTDPAPPDPMYTVIRAVMIPNFDYTTATVAIDGHNAPTAVYTLNGSAIPMISEDVLQLGLFSAFLEFLDYDLSPGQVLTARMSIDDHILEQSATIPAAPVVTAPTREDVVSSQSDLVVRWTSTSNPERFLVIYENMDSDPLHFVVVDGALRSTILHTQVLQSAGAGTRNIHITAVNGGGHLNPIDSSDESGFYAIAEPVGGSVSITVE